MNTFPEVLENYEGVTVKQLKAWLQTVPDEVERFGEMQPTEVWLGNGRGLSNQAKIVWRLNEADVLLESHG